MGKDIHSSIIYKGSEKECNKVGDAFINADGELNILIHISNEGRKKYINAGSVTKQEQKVPTVLCISGKAQNGKDTTANYLYDYLTKNGKKAVIIHYADLLKFICSKYFGWNGEKDDAGRTLLQRVGTDIVRKRQPNYWVDFVTGLIKLFIDEWEYILIPDTRFPNELSCISSAGFNLKYIRVTRPNFKSPLSEEQQKHPSETALDNTNADYVLVNDSTLKQLYKKIDKIGEELINEAT